MNPCVCVSVWVKKRPDNVAMSETQRIRQMDGMFASHWLDNYEACFVCVFVLSKVVQVFEIQVGSSAAACYCDGMCTFKLMVEVLNTSTSKF